MWLLVASSLGDHAVLPVGWPESVSYCSPPFHWNHLQRDYFAWLGSFVSAHEGFGVRGIFQAPGWLEGSSRGVCKWGLSPHESRIGSVITHHPESKDRLLALALGLASGKRRMRKGLWRRGKSKKLAHWSWIASQKCLLENVDSPPWVRREGRGAGGLVPAPAPAWADHCRGSRDCTWGLSHLGVQAAISVGSWVDTTCSLQPTVLALLSTKS